MYILIEKIVDWWIGETMNWCHEQDIKYQNVGTPFSMTIKDNDPKISKNYKIYLSANKFK